MKLDPYATDKTQLKMDLRSETVRLPKYHHQGQKSLDSGLGTVCLR